MTLAWAAASLLFAAPAIRLPGALEANHSLRADLEAGLAALPVALRPPSLEIEWVDAPADWGLDPEDRLDRLRLFRYREPSDARALAPLSVLAAEQRERLWRQRAIVHFVIRQWNVRLRWSARTAWRSISGWQGARPMLVYSWAFSRAAGQQSAAQDLATFAEELLVPPPDAPARCQQPTKARFLEERLHAIDPSWSLPPQECPALDAWVDAPRLAEFELTFVAPSSASPQAMAGHVFLRIRRPGDPEDGGQVLQLAALVSPREPPAGYFLKGLSGGFRGVFSLASLADVRHEALNLEQRELRHLSLTLTTAQRQALLERAWELERVGYVEYRFFDQNCASMLRFLLGPVLGDEGPRPPPTPWETPTQVLDQLGPRLGSVTTDESSADAAARATQARAETKDKAQALLAALRIERAKLDAATVARLTAERAALLPGWDGPTTEELVAARQRRFEQGLTGRERIEHELSELLALDDALRQAPRRPLTRGEQALLEAEEAARSDFERVAGEVAGLPLEALELARRAERATLEGDQQEFALRAVPESGHGVFSVSAGATLSVVPLLRLRGALHDERLGDQRLRGLGPRTSWRPGTAELLLSPSQQPVERAGVTVLHVRGLARGGWGAGGGLDYAFFEHRHQVTVTGEILRELAANARFSHFLLAHAGVRAGLQLGAAPELLVEPRAGLESRLALPGSFGHAVRLEASWRPWLTVRDTARFEHRVIASAGLQLRLGSWSGVAVTARADLEATWRPTSGTLTGLALVGVDLD